MSERSIHLPEADVKVRAGRDVMFQLLLRANVSILQLPRVLMVWMGTEMMDEYRMRYQS